MRIVTSFIIILLLFSSCKSTKISSNKSVIKSISAKKIIKKHKSVSFDAATLDAKLKVEYSDNKGEKRNRHTFTVRLRIQKDSVIWMKGSKVIPGFKVKITPSTLSYYSFLTKEYFVGDYSLIEKMLGTKISFSQIQSVLFGESILDLKKQKYHADVENRFYKLTPKNQDKLYQIFFFLHPDNFKLKSQILEINEQNKTVQIEYDTYVSLDMEFFPKKIVINATDGAKYTKIKIDCRSLTLNKQISMPFKIPTSYKRIKI
ncbi:MAG: Uncharacterised protein [Flavobacterium sp. SCGC AAA160-P02]|nr:MAG: Uncharacterised protein [Flavobacterium sp. SCGC AAA160-P02]